MTANVHIVNRTCPECAGSGQAPPVAPGATGTDSEVCATCQECGGEGVLRTEVCLADVFGACPTVGSLLGRVMERAVEAEQAERVARREGWHAVADAAAVEACALRAVAHSLRGLVPMVGGPGRPARRLSVLGLIGAGVAA